MTVTIGRRELLVALGGAAAAWPLAARAQQAAMPVIGFLSTAPPRLYEHRLRPFREGLKEAGYVEGQNVEIDYRWAEAQDNQLLSSAVFQASLGWRYAHAAPCHRSDGFRQGSDAADGRSRGPLPLSCLG